MTHAFPDVEIEFDAADAVEQPDVDRLIAELAGTGAAAETLATHDAAGILPVVAIVALVGVSTASAGGLAVIAAFMYRVFRRGVVLDLTGNKPRIRKNPNLPRGSLLILGKDGSQELREGISDADIGTAIHDVLDAKRNTAGGAAPA